MKVGSYLYWLTMSAGFIFWLMDMINMPFMEKFDTTYPLNGLFWFITIIWWALSPVILELFDDKQK